jgi:transposase InsO family protein
VEPDTRDAVVDFVRAWSEKAEVAQGQLLPWLSLGASKFYDWRRRYGKVNEHNAWVPRDHWLEEWEKQAILAYYRQHPLEGYRRLTYMMLDEDVVAVSASSVYRVLLHAGLLERWNRTASKKGTGFVQPVGPHEHWHVDLAYLNIGGTFYYLCSVLDGYSRLVVHWELAPAMKESDVELVLQKAREKYPAARPRIISDNGPQFIAKDFKEFIRSSGMTHVRTSPFYPQSNGKKERWIKSFKIEGWRPGLVEDLEAAKRLTERYVRHYNEARLHSAIGYVTPKDKLEGREGAIFAAREVKLAAARERRAQMRAQAEHQGLRMCQEEAVGPARTA